MSGKVADFLSLGAIIHTFKVGDINIVQNFPTPELYQAYNEPYFGETIGRVANRISGARINNLKGKSYQLAANNGPNCLHGGRMGWGKKVWEGPKTTSTDRGTVTEFRYVSQDGDEGFPGEIANMVKYTQYTEKNESGQDVSVLEIEYQAELQGEVEQTVIGMTNHTSVLSPDRHLLAFN